MHDELSHDQTAGLLRVARSFRSARGQARPVDALIAHLAGREPEATLEGLLGDRRALLEGRADVGELVAMKEAGKRQMNADGEELERLTGLATYFVAVAAALAFHHTLISSRPLEVVRCALLDLGGASPGPYGDLLFAGAAAEPH